MKRLGIGKGAQLKKGGGGIDQRQEQDEQAVPPLQWVTASRKGKAGFGGGGEDLSGLTADPVMQVMGREDPAPVRAKQEKEGGEQKDGKNQRRPDGLEQDIHERPPGSWIQEIA